MAEAGEEITFIDTNVLVYAHDRAEARKHETARELLETLWATRTGTLSTQVLQEFYVVATRKFDPPMSPAMTRRTVGAYGAWPVVHIDIPLIVAASGLQETHRLSFWDALIIEAARRSGASRLATEDVQSGRRIGGVRIENPFA